MFLSLKILILTLLLSISSCASKKKNLNEFEVESYFTMGLYGELINDLDKKVQEDPENQLIHLLNLALAHQANGDYHQSNKVLFKIKEILRWNHILTLKEESLSFFLNENFKKFQVAEYEQLLVQFYITLNFALLNNWNSALVEMRNLDLVLYNLKLNPNFSALDKTHLSYLSAIIYEANGKYDEALIDYQRVYHSNKKHPYLGFDLYRCARLSHQNSLANKYVKEYKIPVQYQNFIGNSNYKKYGEAIFIFQNGFAPHKVEHRGWSNIAVYQNRVKIADRMSISINNSDFGYTTVLMNLDKMAHEFQQGQIKTLFTRDIARKITKEIASFAVGISGGFLGVVATRTLAHSTSAPDLRTWFLLPSEIQIARVNLTPGTHSVRVNYTPMELQEEKVYISKGKKKILFYKFAGNN